MKKRLLIFIFIIGLISAGIVNFPDYSNSAPEVKPPPGQSCGDAIDYGIDLLRQAWLNNFLVMEDQEKPMSAIVDDAMENVRTYHCWLDYFCESVKYSTYTVPDMGLSSGITKDHLKYTVPGCVDIDDLVIEQPWSEYNTYLKSYFDSKKFKINPIYIPKDIAAGDNPNQSEDPDAPDNPSTYNSNTAKVMEQLKPQHLFNNPKSIPYILQCYEDKKNLQDRLNAVTANYQYCKDQIAKEFASATDDKDSGKSSAALVTLKSRLIQAHEEQKIKAFRDKINGILNKMIVMESTLNMIDARLGAVYDKLTCYHRKCN